MLGDIETGDIEVPNNSSSNPNDDFEMGDPDVPENELQEIENDEEGILAEAKALNLTEGIKNMEAIRRANMRFGTLEDRLSQAGDIRELISSGAHA